jgi:p-cumate 2,3-dioxygenase alpha subunit
MGHSASSSSLVVDDREAGLFRVNRSAMVLPEIFEAERERIFETCWLYVGHESEIPKPGDYRRRTIGARPIIFLRDADGTPRALFNACTHRGATICRQDAGNARVFQCFYHAWTFDTTGRLVQVPDEEGYGPCFDKEERNLRAPAHFDSYRGFCFLSYNPDAEPLEDYLAGATEYLDLIAEQSVQGMKVLGGTNLYSIKANWKLLIENSLDGYHAVPVHSTYFDYIASYGEGEAVDAKLGERVFDLGNGHTVLQGPTPYGRPIAHWHPLFGEETKEEIHAIEAELVERVGEERAFRICHMVRSMIVFPNLLIIDGNAITIRCIEPQAPDLLHVSAWTLMPSEFDERQIARSVDSYVTFLGPGGFATPDDVEALESCQEGFRTWRHQEWSDISRGMTRVPRMVDELQMRTFWRGWAARMDGDEPGRLLGDVESEGVAAR